MLSKPSQLLLCFSPLLSNLCQNLKEFTLHTNFHRSLSCIKVAHENSPSSIWKQLSSILGSFEVLSHKTAWACPKLTYLRTAKMSVEPSLRDVSLFIRNRFKETWSLLEKSFPKSDQSLINKVKSRFQF